MTRSRLDTRATMTPARALCALWLCTQMLGCATSSRPLTSSGWIDTHQQSNASPWSSSKRAPALDTTHTWPAASSPPAGRSGFTELAYHVYTNYITKVDGPRCEHRPTCSRYAVEAIRKHGSLVGSWMAIDRLLRSSRSSSLRQLPILHYHEGQPRFHDPVEDNDFFF